MALFARQPVYIKISCNKIEITDLRTGETISKSVSERFSTSRIVLADFNAIDSLIRDVLKELIKTKGLFPPTLSVLIQQIEEAEDGITEIEKRALRDLGELAGGAKVILVNHVRKLSIEEALLELNAS